MITGYSYAKINLCLDVTGRAKNGMHTVDMVMQSISLHDTIMIEKAEALAVTAENMELPRENTVRTAANLFFAHTGIAPNVHIHVAKRIPTQAGLGGGSSNGAATLRMLDRLFGTRLDGDVLFSMAMEIGSDAPFFLTGGCMRATGTGTVLSPVRTRCRMNLLLIKPQEGVSTKEAYRLHDTLPPAPARTQAAIDALEAGNCTDYYAHAKNALSGAGGTLCPQIPEIISECKKKGADFALMTGSGSCVFAVFESEALLDDAYTCLGGRYPFAAKAVAVDFGMDFIDSGK